ncbi:hypothetical protein CC86DRAFT_367995 [Ophiobolus disseminans]|uniref:BHLH domain-containing protein n=1 Tax=Ophiobolus disseminans TaxID=1469910 RepID=A0A6A7ABP1_9PLEO|nr:hypothetical protein CC86DRAFT_367995 [Ophiobolus disseminans]
MGDKDPSPFGYTFTGSGFFDADPTPFDPNHSLLTDAENQHITNFFANTDPFHLADPHGFVPALDTKDSIDGFNNWSDFITPATVHGVSTTIPDQSHLHNNFFNDNPYSHPPLAAHHLGSTHDDLQAASTLFRNSQSSYSDSRPHDFNTIPPPSLNLISNGTSATDQNGKPLVITQHGLLTEQLAAIIPNYAEEGTLDAQLAAQWAARNAQQLAETQFTDLRRPTLKRSYTFGTDESFNNPANLPTHHGQERSDQTTRHLMRDSRQSQPFVHPTSTRGAGVSPIEYAQTSPHRPSDEDPSEDASSEEDEDEKPSKKRRKSKACKDISRKPKTATKNRKASTTEESSKKKRAAAAQKLQRENLTEEQKRSNHILSEQKRRNLIKRGFEDLNELVPELRNRGQSKSGALTEAANFLEKLIEDNRAFRQLVGS